MLAVKEVSEGGPVRADIKVAKEGLKGVVTGPKSPYLTDFPRDVTSVPIVFLSPM